MLRSIGKQSRESVESVREKKRKSSVKEAPGAESAMDGVCLASIGLSEHNNTVGFSFV